MSKSYRARWSWGASLWLALTFASLPACSTPNPAPDSIDCQTALSGPDPERVSIEGAWRGTTVAEGQSTTLELQIVDGRAYATLPERAQYDFPVRAATSGPALCIGAPYRSGIITLHREGRGWRGGWTDPNFQAEVALSRARLPQLPRERALNFVSSDGAQLAGTLVLPARGSGPFTTVVWVHGSRPITRDTWFYRGYAHRLAREGVASLIWDKRGAGASTGEQSWNIDRLTLDAQAAIDAARAAPEVADDGVILAGASQGGWIAPRVAADNPWLAGVMVSAAPGVTIAEQNVYSFERALQLEGIPADLTERAVSLLRAVYEYYRTGEGYSALSARFSEPANEPIVREEFFRNMLFHGGELPGPGVEPAEWSFMFVDYLDYWRRVDQPVLAMWGADDNEVPPVVSRDRIAEALAGHGAEDRVLHILDDATHSLFVHRDPGDPWDWERTAPGFQEDVSNWLRRRR